MVMKTFFLGFSILLATSSITLAEQALRGQDLSQIKLQQLQSAKPVLQKSFVQEIEKLKSLSQVYKDKAQSIKDFNSTRKALDSGGAMDGGGGQGVVLKDGRVLFVDTLPQNPLDQYVASPAERHRILYTRNSVVRNRARYFKNFFVCGKAKLQNQSYAVLRHLSGKVDDLRPLAVEFRLANLSRENFPTDFKNLMDSIPVFANRSSAVAENLQEPVASYQRSRLWISSRMYERMSPLDQCALQVHESLRHLNRVMKLSTSLSTPEIESLTRYIIGISTKEPQSLRRLEAEFLLKDPVALAGIQKHLKNLRHEVQRLEDDAWKASNTAAQKQFEALFWELLNTSSELIALNALLSVEGMTTSLDRLSSPEATLLEIRLLEDGYWDAKSGFEQN